MNDSAAFQAAQEADHSIGVPANGMSREEFEAWQWADDFTADGDGSYGITAWLPGNAAYDDMVQVGAIRCLNDRLQMPQGVRSTVSAPTLAGDVKTADWQVNGATIRVQWVWDSNSAMTITYWQD